jgi:hypothetical protein
VISPIRVSCSFSVLNFNIIFRHCRGLSQIDWFKARTLKEVKVAPTSKEDDVDPPAPEEAPSEEIVGEYQNKRCSSTLDVSLSRLASAVS